MKKSLKIISVCLGSIIVFIIAAIVYFSMTPGENLIKGWTEKRLEALVRFPVSIEKLETDIFSYVEINNLIICSASDSSNDRILDIGRIKIRYSIPDLLGSMISLKELSVENVGVNLAFDSLGLYGSPMPEFGSGDGGDQSGGLSVNIDTISVNGINLHYSDEGVPVSVSVSGGVLAARGDPVGSYDGLLKIPSISAVPNHFPINIGSLEIAGRFEGNRIRFDHIDADCYGLHLTAEGDIGISDSSSSDLIISITGSLDSTTSIISKAFDIPSLMATSLNAEFRIRGTIADPDISFNADFDQMGYDNLNIESAGLRGEYRNNILNVDSLGLITLDGSVAGGFIIRPDSLALKSMHLTLSEIGLSSLWRTVYSEDSPYRGTLNGEIKAAGLLSDPTSISAEVSILGTNLRYLNKPVPDLKCVADTRSGLTIISITHGIDTIVAELRFGDNKLDGKFNASIPNVNSLARFFDQPELTGQIKARGIISGSFENPKVWSSITGTGISYRNLPVDYVFAELTYSDSLITINSLKCEGRLDSIGSGNSPFDSGLESGALSYDCNLNGTLDELSGDMSVDLKGAQYGSFVTDSIKLNVAADRSEFTLKGILALPNELDLEMDAVYNHLSAKGTFDFSLLGNPADTAGDIEPGDITVEYRKDNGSIKGDFTLKNDSEFLADIWGNQIFLGVIPRFFSDIPISGGEIDFHLKISGPYHAPSGTLITGVRDLETSGYRIDSLMTDIRLVDGELVVDNLITYVRGQLLRAAGKLTLGSSADGFYALDDNAALIVEVYSDGIDVSAFKSLLIPDGDISGMISTSMTITGTVSSPRFEGWLSSENGKIQLDDKTPGLDKIDAHVLFNDSLFTIDIITAFIKDVEIETSGYIISSNFELFDTNIDIRIGRFGNLHIGGIISDSAINLDVYAEKLDLTALQPFTPGVDSLNGELTTHVKISGRSTAPLIDGYLRSSGLAFWMPGNYINVSGGTIIARFDRGKISLDTLYAALNGGTIAASGVLERDGEKIANVKFNLIAGGLLLQEPGTYKASVDSVSLNYAGQEAGYILSGDIVLGEVRLVAGLRPTSLLPWAKSIETVDLEMPEILARSRLDVRIRESDKLWIDNNLARIRLRAEMGIIGTPLRPNFTGMLRVEEGYLLYLDRRFKLNEGIIFFNDPARFNPDIKLDATTEVKVYRRTAGETYKVYIKADGPLDKLQYGMYSEPPLDNPDIVALLTLGATRSELVSDNGNNGTGGISAVIKDRARALTNQRISGYLSRKAGSLFGFDQFTIQGNLLQFDNSWGPQLIASKRVTQKIDLTYSTTVGHLNDQAISLGYRLTPRISLQGETDRQGRAGLDLKYGIRFK